MSESDIKTLEKKINNELRIAQNSMFSGKNEEAMAMIEEVWTDIEKLRIIDPNYRNLKSLEQKYIRLQKNLNKKLGKTQPSVTRPVTKPSAPSRTRSPSVQSSPVKTQVIDKNKIPSGVTKRLRDMERPFSQVERYLGSDRSDNSSKVKNATYQLQAASEIMSEIERMYSDHMNHPEVKRAQDKLGELSAKVSNLTEQVQAIQEKADQEKEIVEKQSKEWVEKITPYLLNGGVREKQLELSRMRGNDNLLHQKRLLVEVKQIDNELQSQDWSAGKTWEMEQAEMKLLKMITDGEEAYNQSIKSTINEALSPIKEKLDWFSNDNEWRQDKSQRPNWLYEREKDNITEKMSQVYELIPEIISQSNTDLTNLNNMLEQLEKQNQERLDIIPSRTFMVPEKYHGENVEILKIKAGDLVKEKEPNAQILKVHLIREDWRVEDVIEHTDTSRTAIQHRITYHLPAQVAAQIGDIIHLYNAHIAKNQLPTGTFGSLYGNLEEYPQTMSKENLPN